MSEIDTQAILREIYGDQLSIHHDLYEKSNKHREEHGEKNCSVYPSAPAQAPMWPLLTAMVNAKRFLEVGCGLRRLNHFHHQRIAVDAGHPDSDALVGVIALDRPQTIAETHLAAAIADRLFDDKLLAQISLCPMTEL